MAAPVRIADAAEALGIGPKRLRRLLRTGAPVVRKGRKGRGGATLVDVDAIRQWIAARDRVDERIPCELAASYPQDLADTLNEAWQRAEGIDKNKLAGVLAATWELATIHHLARLRTYVPDLPDHSDLPESIAQMIRQSGR